MKIIKTGIIYFPDNSLKSSSTCVEAFTFRYSAIKMPFSSIMKVDLSMPMYFLPYILFSFMTPYILQTSSFSSDKRGKFREFLSLKLQCFRTLSRLIPMTSYPKRFKSSKRSRNAIASNVQPEVLSFG